MAVAFSPVQSIPSSSIKLKNPQALSFRRNVFTHGKNEIFFTFICSIRVDFKFPGRIPGEVIEPLRLIRNRPLSFAHSMFCIEKCFEILKLLHSFAAVTSPFQWRVICVRSNWTWNFFFAGFFPILFSSATNFTLIFQVIFLVWMFDLSWCRYDFTACTLFCSLFSFHPNFFFFWAIFINNSIFKINLET